MPWTENQNFVVSSFATTFRNLVVSGGTQWIGWDPVAKQIRSWSFDADGTFGEGSWARDGDTLIIKTQSVFRDGRRMVSTTTVTPLDADTVGWQSRARAVDGRPLHDINQVRMRRLR